MKQLEERISKDGRVLDGNVLKVDNFLNHLIDVRLLEDMAAEFHRLFGDLKPTKILTVESSGIGIACVTAKYFDCPVLFAKKNTHSNVSADVYLSRVHSYTQNADVNIVVSKNYINSEDKVLIIDDFLANGQAIRGMMDIISQAGAEVLGAGICVEKAFQNGGNELRKSGLRIESLARINAMSVKDGVEFC